MWAVIGLGNPGRRYARTRHNVGFIFVRRMAERRGVKVKKRKYMARIAEIKMNEDKLILAQPQTYMNQSGLAVREIAQGYQLAPRDIIIVYDDLDIPLGQIRVRREGSGGGHHGLRSVIEELGTESLPRIRVGIGPLAGREEATRFVLAPFGEEEIPLLERGLDKAGRALAMILEGRIDEAMNRFNKKDRQTEDNLE
ncbi:MAG: aminoacyl-tRNA hydrolase [Clostridiales bacterium]|nr:aminoacyl-tRNA hydrolase [Clostridiales bacterium]